MSGKVHVVQDERLRVVLASCARNVARLSEFEGLPEQMVLQVRSEALKIAECLGTGSVEYREVRDLLNEGIKRRRERSQP